MFRLEEIITAKWDKDGSGKPPRDEPRRPQFYLVSNDIHRIIQLPSANSAACFTNYFLVNSLGND